MTPSLPTFLSAPMLAHQGGWDELALIAVPMTVIVGLLILAKRRVDATGSVVPEDQAEDQAEHR